MKNTYKIFAGVGIAVVVLLGLALVLHDKNFAVLNPAGDIAHKQKHLIYLITFLMLIVVIPVFVLTGYIGWKYRASNTEAKHTPDWDHSRLLETIWWGFPLIITVMIGMVIWRSSHDLDPSKSIQSTKKPIKIQVVALEWKWLFIYPEQNIATVNYVQFPDQTPVDFEITADAPMNSLWIPQLGGQIYAMAGMSTHLNLMADKPGVYDGSSANLSGKGFADMKFSVESTTQADFDNWIASIKRTSSPLDIPTYNILARPSEKNAVQTYSSRDASLYATVLSKYQAPMSEGKSDNEMDSMKGHN